MLDAEPHESGYNGYAFQYIDSGEFLDYATKAEYASSALKNIDNVKVVKCTAHVDKNGDGLCDYCGLSGIVATVGDTAYTDIDTAIEDWFEDGGTLTLYTNYSNTQLTSFSEGKPLTIDLNGFPFNDGVAMTLGGAYLTVQDSREGYGGAIASLTAGSGRLTLESGCIKGLTVGAENVVTLMGGSVEGLDCPYPIYKLIPNGYALMIGGNTVDPTEKPKNTETYTVINTRYLLQQKENGSVDYGEKAIPLSFSAKVDYEGVGLIEFQWYRVKDDGTPVLLASSKDIAPDENDVYTFVAKDVTVNADGWEGMDASTTPYEVICVLIGKVSDGAHRWQTVSGGYKLTVDPADLGEISLTFTQAADNSFGVSIKGNLGDGSGTFVFCPWGGNPEQASTLTYCFEVRHNDTLLTEGTDYKIESGNTASNAGSHTITISGLNNYQGTATTAWEIKPYTLPADAANVLTNAIFKYYDGTTSFDLSNFRFGLNLSVKEDVLKRGTVNPAIGADNTAISISLSESDYTITPITFDSTEAGDRTVTFAVTLKDSGNFVFEGDVKTLNVTKSQNVFIRKADAPTLDSAALTVTNELKKTYEVILPAPPALKSPKTYGDITYELASDSVKLNDGYYTSGAKIENGKLILPIESVHSTFEGDIGTVAVKVKTTNYQDATITVNVSAKNKEVQSFTVEDITATYGAAPVKLKINGETFGEVTYKFATNSATDVIEIGENGELTILKAGSATITITAAGDDNHYSAAEDVTVTVNKAPLTVRALDRSVYVGEPAPDLSDPVRGTDYEIEGIVNGDEIEIVATLYYASKDDQSQSVDPDMTKPGSYVIRFAGFSTTSEAAQNYLSDTIDGTLTIDNAPPATYAVTVAESENGSVTASRRSASRGQTVTLTVTPDEGYALSSLTVTDAKGNAVAVTETDGAYSFQMPGSKVTVTAAFAEINAEPRFDDVTENDWFYDDVKWAAEQGLVSGVSDTRFDPNGGCSRAHIVTMLWRAAGCPVVNYLMPFTDVAEDIWYTEAVRWAASERIVLGTSDTTFTPDRICNRAQVAAMLWRYAQWAEMDTTQGGMAIREFEDYADIPGYALEPMGWAVNAGILVGSDNRLDPNADCTRAQIAAILHRALGE